MIDTHTHLNFQVFKRDWKEVVEKSVKDGVKRMIVVGTDLKSSKRAVDLAKQHPALYASVGIHPHHAREFLNSNSQKLNEKINKLKELAKEDKVVAVGEIGLDYHQYRDSRYKTLNIIEEEEIIRPFQRQLLMKQLELARDLNKPIIVHSREAGEEVLKTIKHKTPKIRGVFHCFEGSKKYLRKILADGFYVSFTGNITYSRDRAEVAKEVPLNKLLLETDCPYMKPWMIDKFNHSGILGRKRLRSEPKDVKIIGQFQAKLRSVLLNEVDKQTTKNATDLFGFSN